MRIKGFFTFTANTDNHGMKPIGCMALQCMQKTCTCWEHLDMQCAIQQRTWMEVPCFGLCTWSCGQASIMMIHLAQVIQEYAVIGGAKGHEVRVCWRHLHAAHVGFCVDGGCGCRVPHAPQPNRAIVTPTHEPGRVRLHSNPISTAAAHLRW